MRKAVVLLIAVLIIGCAGNRKAAQPPSQPTSHCPESSLEADLRGLSLEDANEVRRVAHETARHLKSEREACSFGLESVCLKVGTDGDVKAAIERLKTLRIVRASGPSCETPVRLRRYDVLLVSTTSLAPVRGRIFTYVGDQLLLSRSVTGSLGQCKAEVPGCQDGVLIDITGSCLTFTWDTQGGAAPMQ